MSFGVGIGDVVSISTLAWKLFKSCKDASGDFKNLAGEVVSLHVVLKETEELVAENDLSSRQNSQLQHLADGCQEVLQDLEDLIRKYQSLGTKTQRTWDRMKWGSEGIANLRSRLISNTTMLSAYNTTMVNSSVARIERQLCQFMEEVRSGKREGSVMSNGTELLDQDEKNGGWLQLERELEDIGVSPDVFSQHKHFIVNWFQQALARDEEGGNSEVLEPTVLSDVGTESMLIRENSRASSQNSSTSAHSNPDDTSEILEATIAKDLPINGKSLFRVTTFGDLESVDYLLRRGLDINANIYELGMMTALNLAAMYGRVAITQRLLSEPNVEVNIKNHLGHTPLSLASWYAHLEIVQLLLDHPATIIDPTDEEDGQTPLSLAVEQGNTSIVEQLLLKGANPNSQDRYGRTPLAYAAKEGRIEETKLLLACSSIAPNQSDRDGLVPLAQAAESENDGVFRLLVADPRVDLNAGVCGLDIPHGRTKRKGYLEKMLSFQRAKDRRVGTKSGS